VVRELPFVIVSITLEGIVVVLLKYLLRHYLLTLVVLGTSLGVVLDKVGIISSNKTQNTLLAFVADVYSHKHGLS